MISPKDIADMFAELEIYLIQSFRRNLKRHKDWEKDEGFEWSAWQAEKLRELNIFRRQNKTIAKNFISRIMPDTRQMLIEQYKEGSDTTPSFFGINERRLNALIDEMQTIEQDVTKAALRNIDDAYRQTVLKAAAALNSGTMTLYQAVDMASKEFLSKGINCVQYKDGRRVNIVSYAEMALRTNATRARLYGQRAKMKELGIDTVIISQYGGCSPTCLPWQGKVYIDDVFCDFEGKKGVSWGISNNGNSYMLLSHAIKNGLFHPNCRHNARIYREGITRIRPPLDKDTVNKNYALEQQQHKLERRVRRAKRLEAGTLDPERKKEYTAQRKAAQKQLREFIKEHDDVLRRDLWREKVSTESMKPAEYYRRKDVSHRKLNKKGQQIIDKPTYNLITRDFIAGGGIIIRGEEAERHLGDKYGASYLPSLNSAFIRDDATVSDVLEEMYHAKQDKNNMFGSLLTDIVLIKREIDAQKYLIKVAKKYKIPVEETLLTKRNLKDYELELERLLGKENSK